MQDPLRCAVDLSFPRVLCTMIAMIRTRSGEEIYHLDNEHLSTLDLRGADLSGQEMDALDLSSLDLQSANFSGSELYWLMMNNAHCRGANFRGARLSGAMLNGTDLRNCDFTDAYLSYDSLQGAASVCRSDLRGAVLQGVNLKGCKYDEGTKFPEGFDPSAAGMEKLTRRQTKVRKSASGRGMMMSHHERVHLYPGAGAGERHYLDKLETIRDIAEKGLVFRDGKTVGFFDIDASAKRDRDDLLFEGVVHYDAELKKWYAVIDWESFRHESDEEPEG